jgi:hypothetical protein
MKALRLGIRAIKNKNNHKTTKKYAFYEKFFVKLKQKALDHYFHVQAYAFN